MYETLKLKTHYSRGISISVSVIRGELYHNLKTEKQSPCERNVGEII